MMVLSGKAGEGGGYDFRANATAGRRATLYVSAQLETARPSAPGSSPSRREMLVPRGVWRSIERNAPEAFKSAIALNPTRRWACRRKPPPVSCFSRGRQLGAAEPTSSSMRSPSLHNEPDPIRSISSNATAVGMWADRQGASPRYRGREFPRHNSQLAQLPSNCALSLLGHRAVPSTTIGSFRCFRLQNGCGRNHSVIARWLLTAG
jgi:hypothetical protein